MKVPYLVKEINFLDDYKILITFTYGEKKVFDFSSLLDDIYYEKLKNYQFFRLAHIQGPSIAWNDEIDINPESLYENSTPYNE